LDAGRKTAGGDRWSYAEKSSKKRFVASMYIISLACLLHHILIFELLPEISYRAFMAGIRRFGSDFFYSLPAEEAQYIEHILNNIAGIAVTLTATLITAVFIVLCLRRFAAQDMPEKITFKFRMPENSAVLLAAGLCIMHISMFFIYGMHELLFYFTGIARFPEYAYFPQTVFGIILYFIAVVIVPSFAEEYIFRYLMLNALRKYGNAFAIISTSVLFGFAHARAGAFIYATAVGIFCAYITIKTRSIWFAVILHALINSASLIIRYISVSVFPEGSAAPDAIYFSFLSVLSAVVLVYIITLAVKRKKPGLSAPADYEYISKKRKLIYFFNAAAVIFFFLTEMAKV
jgi:membrane protease YdiL (CAAX protease family)